MANEQYLPSKTKTYKYDGAQYRLHLTWSETDGGIAFTVKVIIVTDSKHKNKKFKSKHKYKYTWTDKKSDGGRYPRTYTIDKSNNGLQDGNLTFNRTTAENENVKIRVQIGSDKERTFESISSKQTIIAPSSAPTIEQHNNNWYTISGTGSATGTKPVLSIQLQRKTDNGTWEDISGAVQTDTYTNKFNYSFDDRTTSDGHRYSWRVKVSNNKGSAYSPETAAKVTNPTTTQTIQVREVLSDKLRILSWSLNDMVDYNNGVLTGWIVEVQENDGIFLPIGYVPVNNLQYTYYYIHIPIPGHTAKYRLRAVNESGASYIAGESTDGYASVPLEPNKVHLEKTSDLVPKVTITNPKKNTATYVSVQVSVDGGDFVDVFDSDPSYPLNSFTDSERMGNSSVQYRVRNYNDKGDSKWVTSETISTLEPPEAPILLEPFDGYTMDIDDESGEVTLEFQHVPRDGSSQSNANIKYRVNGGAWHTENVGIDTTYILYLSDFSVNDVIEWSAQTKGSHADYGPWAGETGEEGDHYFKFTLLHAPEIDVTAPNNFAAITSLPITLIFDYSDQSGTLTSLEVPVYRDGEDEPEWTFYPDIGQGTGGTYVYPLTGVLFENKAIYTIMINAESSSGLNVSKSITITTDYTETAIDGSYYPIIMNSDDGMVSIALFRDRSVEPEDYVTVYEAYLYRYYEGIREQVGAFMDLDGAFIVDKYAPLNMMYKYELLMLTDDSRVILYTLDNIIESEYSYIYFKNGVFRSKWNPQFSVSFDRPERVEKRYSGRQYPISYDSKAMSETCSYSTVLVDKEDAIMLKRMMREGGGQGIWKSVDGDAYLANFKASYNTDRYYDRDSQVWSVTLDVTRIEE